MKRFESKLFQVNAGKRRAATYDIQLRTKDLSTFVVLIQEPWMVRGLPVALDAQHQKLFATCDQSKPARALIYNHKDANVAPCPEFTGRDVACGLWDVGKANLPQVMLISLYWDINFTGFPQKFLDCLRMCRDKKIPVHIGGDFNAHQILWGGRKDTRRGNMVQWLMVEFNLVLLNEGDVPTFQNANGSSVIDLTMTSPECIELVSSWGVITRANGSDHRTIETRYLTQPPEKVMRRSSWRLKRARIMSRSMCRTWEIAIRRRNALGRICWTGKFDCVE